MQYEDECMWAPHLAGAGPTCCFWDAVRTGRPSRCACVRLYLVTPLLVRSVAELR